MKNLQHTVEMIEKIREVLAAEVATAREERVLIRTMDVDALLARAAKRAEFNHTTEHLQQRLAAELGEVAASVGLTEVTLDALKSHFPDDGQRMANLLAEVRALAAALSELDGLNRMLGQRALSYVRAHLSVLSPRSSAYDRRGGAPSASRSSTVVRVV